MARENHPDAPCTGVSKLLEAQLRGPMGMTTVRWLTSPELALACRTGFAPGDRAGIVEAVSATGVTDDDALELAVEGAGGAGGFGAAAAPEAQVVTVPLDMRNEGGAPSATDLKRALLRLCLTIDEPTGAAKLLRLQAGRNPGAELPDDCRFNNYKH